MISSREDFMNFIAKFPQIEAISDSTPNGVYFETQFEHLSYHRSADDSDAWGAYVTFTYQDDGTVIICNGVDASGEDYLMSNPTEEEIQEIVGVFKDGNRAFDWISGFLRGRFGTPVGIF